MQLCQVRLAAHQTFDWNAQWYEAVLSVGMRWDQLGERDDVQLVKSTM